MGDTNPFRMDGKQQQRAVNIDQNPTELVSSVHTFLPPNTFPLSSS